ncbi:MAG: glycosyltransferase [bacterium]|nr:glycosyltransferase [bacterium]
MGLRASVLLSTYNQPELLDIALHGFARQTTRDFELVIADDGSRPETKALIDRHAADFPVPIVHVWQPDVGFTKSRSVNRAVLHSKASALVFSDGDCIPAPEFVEQHLEVSRPGCFAVGGHVRLSEDETKALTPDMVHSGEIERRVSAMEKAHLWSVHLRSLVYIAARKRHKPKMYGLNFSVDRDSFYKINGFDETYKDSGKEDSDIRNRLLLAGIRPISLWHKSLVTHQYHPVHMTRGGWKGVKAYYNRDSLQAEAPTGLRQLAAEIEAKGADEGRSELS